MHVDVQSPCHTVNRNEMFNQIYVFCPNFSKLPVFSILMSRRSDGNSYQEIRHVWYVVCVSRMYWEDVGKKKKPHKCGTSTWQTLLIFRPHIEGNYKITVPMNTDPLFLANMGTLFPTLQFKPFNSLIYVAA